MRCDCRKLEIIPSFKEHIWTCILNDGFPYYLGYDCEKITANVAINAVKTIEKWYIYNKTNDYKNSNI